MLNVLFVNSSLVVEDVGGVYYSIKCIYATI